jgi:hypothetical protein
MFDFGFVLVKNKDFGSRMFDFGFVLMKNKDFGSRMFDFGFILMKKEDFGSRMFDFGFIRMEFYKKAPRPEIAIQAQKSWFTQLNTFFNI